MSKKDKKIIYLLSALSIILAMIVVVQGTQISKLKSEPRTAGTNTLQQILIEMTPTGVPDYGSKAGVNYDNVEISLRTLTGYSSLVLDGSELNRYIKIGTSSDTACEYCCGIGNAGFGTSDGGIACGCSHNVAFAGLTKWLIKNTNYNDNAIVNEIKKWKTLFFPKDAVREELARRGINPESVGLPSMVGGC